MALLAQLRSCELKPFRRFGEAVGHHFPAERELSTPSRP
jgi:hypothetical protein